MITLAGVGAIINNSENNVFMVRVKRRDMIRWELPTRVRREGESIFLSLYRCIEEESASQFKVYIGRPVCFGLNSSPQLGYQYFAIFFECKLKAGNIRLTEYTDVKLPEESRQKILDSSFVDWQQLASTEIHPQHQEILSRWQKNKDGRLFAVISDADSEFAFYQGGGSAISFAIKSIEQSINRSTDKINTHRDVTSQFELFNILAERFNEEEIKTLCLHLNIDYDNLPAQGKMNKVRELLLFLERRKNIGLLIGAGKRIRPDIDWFF